MLLHESQSAVVFYIQVVPNASQTCIAGITTKYDKMVFKLHVKAVPERGKANKEIIDYLGKSLGVNKNQVVIDKGETDKFKKIKILNVKLNEIQQSFQVLGFL